VTSWKRRALLASIEFWEIRRNRTGPNQASEGVGNDSHVFSGQKSLHRQSSVRLRIVMVKQPVLVPPSFRMFSAGLHPHMIQNLQVVMLVHRLAWRNKFLVNIALTVKKKKKITNMLLIFDPRLNRVCVLPMALSPKAVVSISCFSDAVFPNLKQNFTQTRCYFKSTISLITQNIGSHLTRTTINTR
jgi:hypothetical protein